MGNTALYKLPNDHMLSQAISQGAVGSAIGWGPWAGAGMAAADSDLLGRLLRQGWSYDMHSFTAVQRFVGDGTSLQVNFGHSGSQDARTIMCLDPQHLPGSLGERHNGRMN